MSDLSLLQQVGAQVMLLKNLEMGTAGNGARMLVNGSRGVITNFLSKQASLILVDLAHTVSFQHMRFLLSLYARGPLVMGIRSKFCAVLR